MIQFKNKSFKMIMRHGLHTISRVIRARRAGRLLRSLRAIRFYIGHCPIESAGPAVILFPFTTTTLCCGLAGLVRIKNSSPVTVLDDPGQLDALVQTVEAHPMPPVANAAPETFENYLGGGAVLDKLYALTCEFKREDAFLRFFENEASLNDILQWIRRLDAVIAKESQTLQDQTGHLTAACFDMADQRMEKLKDIAWCLKTEVCANISKVKALMAGIQPPYPANTVKLFRQVNTVFNSIDRLEVRGRDSAGISLLFTLGRDSLAHFHQAVEHAGLSEMLTQRTDLEVLSNRSISLHKTSDDGVTSIAFTYKVAAEIGSLGDNVRHLRQEISQDPLLHLVTALPYENHTVSAHTRWASVGAITIANCHPVDNTTKELRSAEKGIIHACLNGDIDNYRELKTKWEQTGESLPDDITTDTKIIPLQIEHYLRQGITVAEAFRLALNDFKGSHAITMHTDLAPGKLFLGQKGSGQAVFVGIAPDHYLPTSEVYGFVEETSSYIKLDGERVFEGPNGPTQGQIFILDQNSNGGLSGITASYYDGAPIFLDDTCVQHTAITSRDIDRQDFPHYFLKEISEAPQSVAKTIQNRWKVNPDEPDRYKVILPESSFPNSITQALTLNRIRRIYFIGQGTAGIAASACADILNTYLNEPSLKINALKASELSGFQIDEQSAAQSMTDTLVIAITQSGTTTDTNRAIDMVRARGAHTLAIVNRRDSDITFKVDGVVYTSSGRDIEMSVASTKAFYAQIVAGALVGLKIAEIKQRRSPAFITEEIKALLALPGQMRRVLALKEKINASAKRLAPSKTYWAAVGSGPNKAAADEIRIKLSELCYKTISSDYIEDKKHIDLSSEPLILICAAGAKGAVIGDIIKDTAIFKAHKATPVVVVDEGETRFTPYAADVFEVPGVSAHLAPILNTLVGHLWGYYAALAINDGSRFLHHFREDVRRTVDQYTRDGLDVYEVVLERNFREKIAQFYINFRKQQASGDLPIIISHATDLLLLLKYLAGRLPVSDFEMDFGKKGTALNMLTSLFEFLGRSINSLSRPVDAIKHQAKTVTVGTSRIIEKIEGLLFDALEQHDIGTAQLINRNILVLKNLQAVISKVNGSILYRIDGLDGLGEPTDNTTIEVLRKEGLLKTLTSRVENDKTLKGTKRIIVRQGNVYIGKGRKDDRSILIVPVIDSGASTANQIRFLLLLNISFCDDVPLSAKIKALGGKYEHIKNIVQENSVSWEDRMLERVAMDELFGLSAEKIGEYIVAQMSAR